eukprot:TRINITY_DN215_c0_g2_i2.p1 TRINITY_DN215_c0_g2~~TRINITY_DN215_c0_g2_i2.p1  ORF type:complete len:127 (+),score=6.60 TRINITY_DN215_c0_g2_i2:424-804(+)
MPCWELNPSLVHTAATTTPTIHVALLFRSSQEHGCYKPTHCTDCHLPMAVGTDPAAMRLPLSKWWHSVLGGRPLQSTQVPFDPPEPHQAHIRLPDWKWTAMVSSAAHQPLLGGCWPFLATKYHTEL